MIVFFGLKEQKIMKFVLIHSYFEHGGLGFNQLNVGKIRPR